MVLTILGCHSATPRQNFHTTSQLLNFKNHLFMIDCGEGTQIRLREEKINFSKIKYIFISHLHGDHFYGLIGLINTFKLLGRKVDLNIYGPLGIKEIKVYKLLKVAIFSCGDELTDVDNLLKKSHIYDSNREMIKGFLIKLGYGITDLGILEDDKNIIQKKLKKAAMNNDLIITSGGMSLGDEDHIKKIIEKNGTMHAWRLAIKPGRPVGFGLYNNCPIIGLPGNPAAAFITFLMLAIPILKQVSGQKIEKYRIHPNASKTCLNMKK